MIDWLSAQLWKRWLRKRDCKFGSIGHLGRESVLILEKGVSIGSIEAGFKSLEIGAMTYVRSGSELMNVSCIGRFCSVGNAVVIGQEKAVHPLDWVSSHPFQYTDTAWCYQFECAPTEIGHDVWIGREAMIMEGVRIGTGAVVAARSVVTRDVPPYAIVAGIPARIVKYRHSPILIESLLASAWWECPVELLRKLPLHEPEQFLAALQVVQPDSVSRYTRIEVRRMGCREIK